MALRLVPGGVALASLWVAHAGAVALGPGYAGPLRVASHGFTLVAATGLLGLCVALGVRVLRKVGLDLDGPVELLAFAAVIGVALVGTLLLGAGAVGGLRPWGVAVVLLGLVALAWPAGRETWEAVRGLPEGLRTLVPEDGLRRLGLAATAVAALLMLLPALAPPSDWDSLTYHLDVPAEYLATGAVGLPVDNFHAGVIGPVQMLYVPLLAVDSAAGPAVVSSLLALLLALTVAAVASRLLSSQVAGLCLIALWSNTLLLFVAATPRIDTTLVLFTLLGHFALLLAWTRRSRGFFFLAAVILGAGVGVKLQALAYILALLPLVAWLVWIEPWRDREGDEGAAPPGPGEGRLPTLATFAALGVLAAAPWLMRNQLLMGDPFYTLFQARPLEPWLAAITGSSAVPEAVDPYALRWLGAVRQPFNLRDAILAPWRLTVEPDRAVLFLSPLLVLVPLGLVDLRGRGTPWLLVGGLGYALALLLPFPRTNLRYLAPAVVPLTMVAVHGLVVVASKIVARQRAVLATLVVVYLSLAPTALGAAVAILLPSVVGQAAGLVSEEEYLAHPARLGGLRRVARAIPGDARVLLLFESRGFALEQETLQDNNGRNWPFLRTTGAPERCLAGTGISHVLMNTILIRDWTDRGFDPVRMGIPAFRAFEARCLEEIAREEPYVAYRVRAAPRSPAG